MKCYSADEIFCSLTCCKEARLENNTNHPRASFDVHTDDLSYELVNLPSVARKHSNGLFDKGDAKQLYGAVLDPGQISPAAKDRQSSPGFSVRSDIYSQGAVNGQGSSSPKKRFSRLLSSNKSSPEKEEEREEQQHSPTRKKSLMTMFSKSKSSSSTKEEEEEKEENEEKEAEEEQLQQRKRISSLRLAAREKDAETLRLRVSQHQSESESPDAGKGDSPQKAATDALAMQSTNGKGDSPLKSKMSEKMQALKSKVKK